MDSPTDRDVNEALTHLARRLKERHADCVILLFGSRARGTNLLTSDADVVVVTEAFGGMREDERMVSVLEAWEGPVSLQPLCYTPEEFEERRRLITITAIAAREGRAIT